MTDDQAAHGESEILRVFQSKGERKALYNKIAKVYDLLAEHSEQPMRNAGLEKLAAGARKPHVGLSS